MRACKHHVALGGRYAEANPRGYQFPTVPMIYQQAPSYADGVPILPHVWFAGTRRIVQVADTWAASQTDTKRAAAGMAAWCAARWATYKGLVCLNIESIKLDTPQAKDYWGALLEAMRAACPNVQWGFYDRPDLHELIDWSGPSIYPFKFVRPDSIPVIANGEHEYTTAFYMQVAHARIKDFAAARKPVYVFASTRIHGDPAHSAGWASTHELTCQWRVAEQAGADLIWWEGIHNATDERRFALQIEWLSLRGARCP